MASFTLEGDLLTVSGELGADEIDDLVRSGQELLASGAEEVVLDIGAVSPRDSSFIGAIARLGADARARSKKLVVRAGGRAADMLVWAGLHRVVTLHVSNVPATEVAQ